jgi:uncharacterized membrane protein
MRYTQGLIAILIVANIVIASALICSEWLGKDICVSGFNCEKVLGSQYANLLGIPLSVFGAVAFLALLILYIFAYKRKINYKYFVYAAALGALFALYFLYLQFFVIKSICSNCLFTDAVAIIIFGLSIKEYLKN